MINYIIPGQLLLLLLLFIIFIILTNLLNFISISPMFSQGSSDFYLIIIDWKCLETILLNKDLHEFIARRHNWIRHARLFLIYYKWVNLLKSVFSGQDFEWRKCRFAKQFPGIVEQKCEISFAFENNFGHGIIEIQWKFGWCFSVLNLSLMGLFSPGSLDRIRPSGGATQVNSVCGQWWRP